MTRTIHVTVDLLWALRLSDRKLSRMLVDRTTGKHLAAHEIRAHCVELLRRGYDALPACDDHDAKGYCRGHEAEADGDQADADTRGITP